MTAPERIWAGEGEYWNKPHVTNPTAEYILHTRAALAASPLVQEIVAEAVEAVTGNVACGEGHSCPHGPHGVCCGQASRARGEA